MPLMGLALILAGSIGLFWTAAVSALDEPPRSLTDRTKWRFEFDNDVLTGRDDGFSAGWSVQRHSPHFDLWGQKREGRTRKGLSLWIGEHTPGLGDDGEDGRTVRRAAGISQLIQTPADIANPDPQPDDVPWAGVAGFASSWSSYSNLHFAALQVFFGCMGPCSGAEQVQRLVHDDLELGEESPLGWDNQLDTELLGNLNYALRHKVAAPTEDRYQIGRFAGDLSIGGQAAVGNYFSLVEAQLELRFGWGLPMGFTHISDPAGRGIMMDPGYLPPGETVSLNRPRFYFSIVPRYTYFGKIRTLEGGDTRNGGFHPGIDYDDTTLQMLFGFHIAYKGLVAHVTYYHFPDIPIDVPSETGFDWVNFSFEWHL